MPVAINLDTYANFLKNSTFANISAADDDTDIDKEFNNIQTPQFGWYCTRIFFKKTIIVEDKPIELSNTSRPSNTHDYLALQREFLTETVDSKKNKKTNNVKFDENFFKKINTEIQYQHNKDSYFQFFFPVIIKIDSANTSFGIINFNIKKLPVAFSFSFNKSGNNEITTTPLLNEKVTDGDSWLDDGLKGVDNTYFDYNYYEIPANIIDGSKIYTYSDFLEEFISEAGVKTLTLINFNSQKELGKNTSINMSGGPGAISFNNEAQTGYTFDIQNTNNRTSKKINIGAKGSNDARDLYYLNCIDNQKVISNDQKKKEGNVTVNKNKSPNYYDISFDCHQLHTFMNSSFTPGYHVLAYYPTEIYKNLTLNDKESHTINFINVYKQIFTSKIIDITVILTDS